MKAWHGVVGTFAAAGATFLVLLLTSYPVPDVADGSFDLAHVRALAGDGGPVALQATKVASGSMPGASLVRGGAWAFRDMPMFPVIARWEDGHSVVIDTASNPACSKAMGAPPVYFDAEAYDRLQQEMLNADHIVVTHEHFDHTCAIADAPDLEALGPKLRLTRTQLDGGASVSSVNDRVRAVTSAPLDLTEPLQLAPGVVVIPAPGHTVGSLWVYVREAAGREWLFVGDTVWTTESLDRVVAKPLLLAAVGFEDGAQQAAYIRTLVDLREQHPEVRVMVSHEQSQWVDALAAGDLTPF